MNPRLSDAAAGALREPGRLPVFVSADGRRRRVLRLTGRVLAGLTALWLVALLAGVLGLGRLPGVSLPEPATGEDSGSPATSPAATRSRASLPGGAERRAAATRSTRHGSASAPATHRRGTSGAVVPRRASGPGGASTTRPRPQPHAPAAKKSPSPAASSPARPSAPANAHGANPHGGGKPAKTESPGSRANPSPSGTEHSHKWSTGGG
jgi:hypothetical protein